MRPLLILTRIEFTSTHHIILLNFFRPHADFTNSLVALQFHSFTCSFNSGKGMKIGKWEILYTHLQTEGGSKNVSPMQKVMTKL